MTLLPELEAEGEGAHGRDDVLWIVREFFRSRKRNAPEIRGKVAEVPHDGVLLLEVLENLKGIAGVLAAFSGATIEVG